MYNVLDKDTINNEIIPHLSQAKRGYVTQSCLIEIVNGILYKLKTGCQWHMLPVKSLFTKKVLSYQAVYWHFRKWSKDNNWKQSWILLLEKHKQALDLFSADIDGSHTTALRGGQEVGYQERKSRKTTNSLYQTDRQGLPLALSSPVAGNHHDLYRIDSALEELFETLSCANIRVDGLFINADAGFDSKVFRGICFKNDITANVAFNKRNGCKMRITYWMMCFIKKDMLLKGQTLGWTVIDQF